MSFDHGDTCAYVAPSIFEVVPHRTLSAYAHRDGRCDGCTRGYHAGEQVAIDSEIRILHWDCHIREIRLGGHLMEAPRIVERQQRR